MSATQNAAPHTHRTSGTRRAVVYRVGTVAVVLAACRCGAQRREVVRCDRHSGYHTREAHVVASTPWTPVPKPRPRPKT